MTAFNVQDLQNLQVFLNRVNLQGNESMAHAELMIKIANGLQQLQNPEPPPADPPPVPPPGPNGEGKHPEE